MAIASTQRASVRYRVDDVDRAVDFYTTYLGFTLGHHAASAFADVMRDPLRLLLSGPTSSGARPIPDGSTGLRGGWNRIHLIVDDITAEVARARVASLSSATTSSAGRSDSRFCCTTPQATSSNCSTPPTD